MISGFSIAIHIGIHSFFNFFLSVNQWAGSYNGPLQLCFTRDQTSSYATDYIQGEWYCILSDSVLRPKAKPTSFKRGLNLHQHLKFGDPYDLNS